MRVRIEQDFDEDNAVSLSDLVKFVDAVKASSDGVGHWPMNVYIEIIDHKLVYTEESE